MKYAAIFTDKSVFHFSAPSDKEAKEKAHQITKYQNTLDSVYRTPRGRIGKLVLLNKR